MNAQTNPTADARIALWSPTITLLSELWYVRRCNSIPRFEVVGEAENEPKQSKK